jgi:hypothetical protein
VAKVYNPSFLGGQNWGDQSSMNASTGKKFESPSQPKVRHHRGAHLSPQLREKE